MLNVHCMECKAMIHLGNHPQKGQIIYCNQCGARMVVVKLSPIELEWLFDEGYDDWPRYHFDFKYFDSWN
jgi:lysine biosynthesis protein LysW